MGYLRSVKTSRRVFRVLGVSALWPASAGRLPLHEALGRSSSARRERQSCRPAGRSPLTLAAKKGSKVPVASGRTMEDGGPDMKGTSITANSSIDELLKSYPETGGILIQSGRLYSARTGHLYLEFPPLTIADYATLN